ncbi:flagellar assembly factor FliW [Paenibacillus taihuensis]|uniref:Flagellar assembly factor FliW n=1 Tax=Paenibacillus taihuensis TaxID=1156355 RepID=A0A3D9S7F7_9BACL|nr:flagellar assembly protein FliW [Paenibacillus taihuensis]REE84482.1 flagellar assembly factor FliW [Paenibacillus taihuensis]
MLNFLHDRVFQLNGTILGFDQCNAFVISVVEENDHFAYMRSVDQEGVEFLVVSPFSFYPEYWVELEEKDNQLLGIQSPEDVCVLSIVTINDPFGASTLNLLAPIILNVKNEQGKQTVLSPKRKYSTVEPLLKAESVGSGE